MWVYLCDYEEYIYIYMYIAEETGHSGAFSKLIISGIR